MLLEKPLEEIESNRVSILEKQKKIILTSLASHLSQHILPILNPGSLPKNSLIQAKNLSKLKEITHGSDENDSPRDEGQVRRDSRPPLRRLLRRNSPIRGVAVINELTTANLQMRDFDDPEDENWELDSSVSLDFKPKRVNTRNRTSTRPSQGTQRESGYDKNGIKTRGIKKKVQLNDDDSDYKANGILRSESEEDYDSSQEDRKRNGNREGLRNKENHKRYRDRSDEEEFKEFDDGLKENNQKPKFKKQQVTKRKERNFIENEDHLDFEPPCEKKTKLNKNFEWYFF